MNKTRSLTVAALITLPDGRGSDESPPLCGGRLDRFLK